MRREGYRWQSRPWRPSEVQARILDGVVQGKTNSQIAAEVGMTVDGVKWHITRALSELGLEDRHSLARWWQSPSARGARMSLDTGPGAHERGRLVALGPCAPAWGDKRALPDAWAPPGPKLLSMHMIPAGSGRDVAAGL
ncbi:MAG TPA: helix-turn-helix transcriptional regulator [Dehalococcoidia bacterium]|nr:helix-turn-helix transcriptional regulator [Dehalococcoidia bacterium]